MDKKRFRVNIEYNGASVKLTKLGVSKQWDIYHTVCISQWFFVYILFMFSYKCFYILQYEINI